MNYLFDFGISQDDPLLENEVLSLSNSNLLCLASGGEVPLGLLALQDVKITAVDISINQIRLCRLKLAAVLTLLPDEASEFLGFTRSTAYHRKKFYNQIIPLLSKKDVTFWNQHIKHMEKGIVWSARFEKYLIFFCKFAVSIMGRSKIKSFIQMENRKEQQEFFDSYLDKPFLKWIFKIVFSPVLYKKRGLNPQGLINQRKDMASFFYSRFRDFFIKTPARKNFYLQFYVLGEIQFPEGLPEYLNHNYYEDLRTRLKNVKFIEGSVQEVIRKSGTLDYKNYSLSNLSDWLDENEMNKLIEEIVSKNVPDSKWLLRFIHKDPINERSLKCFDQVDRKVESNNNSLCRFPFYSSTSALSKGSSS